MSAITRLARTCPRGLPLALPHEIDIGTCVRISPAGGWRKADITVQGVVVEVVLPRRPILAKGIVWGYSAATSRSSANRYVIQTEDQVVVRRAAELEVDAL